MYLTLIEFLTNYFTPVGNNKFPLTTYSDIEKLMKLNFPNLIIFIYKNKDEIHEILYDEDKVLKLPSTFAEKGIQNLFYIVLLIKSDSEMINYNYEIDFIQKVNNIKNSSKSPLTIFLFSLILMQLIDNYKASNEEDPSLAPSLEKLYKECQNIKNDFKKYSKKMNLNINEENIDEINLEEIYIDIINSLLSNKKLEDYAYSSSILGQIELDQIELTEKMYQDLLHVFNDEKNVEYINEFYISEVKDLFDEKKLSFYLTIFNYILKESIYIYNFNFLLKARNEILKIIKSEENINLINDIKNEKLKKSLNFIINKFCDNNYYINNYLNKTNRQLNAVLQYYKDFYFYTKEKEITQIENYLNNNTKISLSKNELSLCLNDYPQSEKIKKFRDLIYYFIKERKPEFLDKNDNIKEKNEKAQKEMDKFIIKIQRCAKMFEDKVFQKKMRRDDRITIYRYFKYMDNEKKNLEIIPDKKEFDSFMEDTSTMISDKDSDKKENINIVHNNNLSNNLEISDKKNNNDNSHEESTGDTETKKGPSKIISPQKKLKNEEEEEENIELIDEICDESQVFENCKNVNKNEEKENEESSKQTYAEENDKKEVLVVKLDKVYKIKSTKTKGIIKTDSVKLNNLNLNSCLSLDETNQIIFSKEGAFHYKNLFGDISSIEKKNICEHESIGGIKLEQNLIVFTSHIGQPKNNDTDKLIFYKPSTEEIINEIEGYYFNNGSNGLKVITPGVNNYSLNNILLCACRKVELGKTKNGILLINIDNIEKYNGEKDENIIRFIDTGEFKVNTFCQLKTKNDSQTDYFLVGGYSQEEKKGVVKLFKNIYTKNKNQLDIKNIATLDLENNGNVAFEGFEKAVNCIIQSAKTKKVIIRADKDIHIFSEPDFAFDKELVYEDDDKPDWTILESLNIN